ncbi:MAG: glycoside hydrolase family 127 protein [Oscillospiraceae bacterium]|nr:glycoside hydrolase family 127 protein [Oscillospiraceae bacterium]
MKKVKKLICLFLALALLSAAVPAVTAMEAGEVVDFDGVPYVVVGENLFKSPNFVSESGVREAPQWYVGNNTGTNWNGSVPDPKSGANLTPLEDVVRKNADEANGKQAFYYSSGGAAATGNDNFLCEYITDANGSYWNGTRSLLGYVPIEPNKQYYFSYWCFTNAGGSTLNSSVRYGAIDSADYCVDAANGKITWSGSGGINVDQYDGDNVIRNVPWEKHEAVITSGDNADFFFFNLYWLQAINFVCINGFTLQEVIPAVPEEIERPSVRVYAGESPALPSRLKVTFEGGAQSLVPVVWDGIDTTRDGEYEVAGTVSVGGKEYPVCADVTVYSDSINADYTIAKTITERNGEIVADFGIYTDLTDKKLFAALALYDEGGNIAGLSVATDAAGEFSLSLPAPVYEGYTAKAFVWSRENAAPLATAKAVSAITKEGGQFMSLSDVTLLDGMFKTARDLNEEYLINIEPDRLLAPSMESSGLSAKAARYGGWEAQGHANWPADMGISGHSLGHWLSAVSSASVESEKHGEELKANLDYAVSELARIQEETGSGYIGGLSIRPFEQAFSGTVNTPDGFNLNGAWVPWYSVHKIYQGLIDAYSIAGNTQALEVVKKFADWAVDGTERMTDEQMQRMLNVEHGGMNDVFAQLYAITGNERYLTAAVRFTHNSILGPLAAGRDELTGKHANTQIPKIVGAAAVYEQDNSREDYRAASEYFWDRVVNHRSFVIGGNSVSEHFETEGAETLHIKDAETCNAFNMIKLTEHLYSWEHKSEYMDYVETALYNDILGSQDPDTGNKMYFTSMLQGHFRIYGTPENSWWCCTGSGMENPGRYSKVIYYKDRDRMFVNLYIPSQVIWRETGLTFRMETAFPYSDEVSFTVAKGSGDAAVNFRAPSWLAGDMTVRVNGEEIAAETIDGYVTVERTWNEGDVVELTLPMALSVYTARDNDNKVAFKYGPVVLAAPLGTELPGFDITKEDTRVSELGLPANTVSVPNLITESDDPTDIISVSDVSTLTFSIDGKFTSDGRSLTLEPFYGIHHQFHNVYWYINSEADPRVKFERALNEITVDSVEPDGQQDELGHGLEHKDSNHGSFQGGSTTYRYRDAFGSNDAYFSYKMAVNGSAPNYLYVRYWGSDVPFSSGGKQYTRSFDILIDGEKLASQTLNNDKPGEPYDVFYEIPEEYTSGKEEITVKFAVQSANTCAGGVTEVRITSAGSVNVEE